MQAKRLVIDSLSGFELALAPAFSEDFRGSLYRMIAKLTGMGVTILMTSELEDRFTDLRSAHLGVLSSLMRLSCSGIPTRRPAQARLLGCQGPRQ